MNAYRVTCLTPTLVGDGQRLSPIDYMLWRDQVNVLDQNRIFRLLARGPRLDSNLTQIRKADRLDFASWGGYAQNFATRRIPFDDPAAAAICEKARVEDLFIPTFASGTSGAYLPATAIKGPLRTALLLTRFNEHHLGELEERMSAERLPRYPAEALETGVLGASGVSRTRGLRIADSGPLASGGLRIYLLRTATLVARGSRLELGWKTAPRGAVEGRRPADSTPAFAEMAAPGTVFSGNWSRDESLAKPELLRTLRWKSAIGAPEFATAANEAAALLLDLQQQFAESAGLPALASSIEVLRRNLETARSKPAACLICIGWGSGFLSKTVLLKQGVDATRQLLRLHPLYGRAIQTGLPFPKTRRLVFTGGAPAALPGWVEVDFAPSA